MVEVFVDGKPLMVEPGTTVLQVTLTCSAHLLVDHFTLKHLTGDLKY